MSWQQSHTQQRLCQVTPRQLLGWLQSPAWHLVEWLPVCGGGTWQGGGWLWVQVVSGLISPRPRLICRLLDGYGMYGQGALHVLLWCCCCCCCTPALEVMSCTGSLARCCCVESEGLVSTHCVQSAMHRPILFLQVDLDRCTCLSSAGGAAWLWSVAFPLAAFVPVASRAGACMQKWCLMHCSCRSVCLSPWRVCMCFRGGKEAFSLSGLWHPTCHVCTACTLAVTHRRYEEQLFIPTLRCPLCPAAASVLLHG